MTVIESIIKNLETLPASKLVEVAHFIDSAKRYLNCWHWLGRQVYQWRPPMIILIVSQT